MEQLNLFDIPRLEPPQISARGRAAFERYQDDLLDITTLRLVQGKGIFIERTKAREWYWAATARGYKKETTLVIFDPKAPVLTNSPLYYAPKASVFDHGWTPESGGKIHDWDEEGNLL